MDDDRDYGEDLADREARWREERIEADIDEHIQRYGSRVPYGMGPESEAQKAEVAKLRSLADDCNGMERRVAHYWLRLAADAICTDGYDTYIGLAKRTIHKQKAPGA